MSGSIILAIETSQRIGGVALRDEHGQVHTEMLHATKRHDDDLLPAIDRLMRRAGLSPGDLRGAGTVGTGEAGEAGEGKRGGAVGVSVGPGGFSGLRIAVSTAKMLAEALDVQLVAVPTALVAAESYAGAGPIIVALACKGESFWSTRLERAAAGWRIIGQPGIVDAGSFEIGAIEAVLGDMYLPAAIRARCDSARIAVVEPVFDSRACLTVTARWVLEGRTIDPLKMAPLYPRVPEAVSLWEKRFR
jgi:tRNA threonylcarbamoyl adenosine modification protein YeaZ